MSVVRRVVITGVGVLSPLGTGVETVWSRLVESRTGIGPVRSFDASGFPCQIGGEVPLGDGEGDFDPDAYVPAKERRKMDPFIVYGCSAAQQALEDAGWHPTGEQDLWRTGVMIGSGIGGLQVISGAVATVNERGPRRLSPFFIPSALTNLASGQVSIKYGFGGPIHAVSTACATGTHAIGDAARLIALDDADVMVAGGAEAGICPLGFAGFCASRALSVGYNDNATAASRPWDKGRDGFVMGEGAGVVVLEEYEHARARGAKVYAEVAGYGMSGDAHHITAPPENGNGALRAMQAALKNAGLNADDVDYVNAHGTSTPLGDEIEFRAVKRLLGNNPNLAMSSTKSAVGHLLGAAGAVEAIFSAKAIQTGIMPPTLNLDDPSESCTGINLVPKEAQEKKVTVALSNSFGFGGTNASLVLRDV